MLHRVQDLLVRERNQLINAIRAHLGEFGVIEAKGPWNVTRLLETAERAELPEAVVTMTQLLAAQLEATEQQIGLIDGRILAQHKGNPVSQRLGAVPGIGPLVATAMTAMVPDPKAFKSGREFAA